MSQEQKEKEYQTLLQDLYKENQNFLNKAIFGVSSLAIPFLFEVLSQKKDFINSSILLGISLIGFCLVIFMQISSLKNARDGCDKSIKIESREDGNKLFELARKKDIWRERIFIFSLFLTAFTLLLTKFTN
jgi:hypothetical protein